MMPEFVLFGHRFLSYHVCAVLAGLCLLLPTGRLGARRWFLPVATVLAALVGARLLNFLLNPEGFEDGFALWTLSYQKLSLVGGLVTGTLTLLVLCRLAGADLWTSADEFVFPGALALCIVKLGCFLNGCCYGKKTTGPLGMRFARLDRTLDLIDRLPLFSVGVRTVYPTQLFELIGYLLGAVVLWLVTRKRPLRGYRAPVYGIWVILVRLAVHPLRMFPYPPVVTNVLYPCFYLVLLAALVGCCVCRHRAAQKPSP